MFFIALSVRAETFEATSHVSAATVFSDRALLTRKAKVHVASGVHVIAITDMPPGINEASLRVQGKAVANVKIGAVEVKHVYLTEQANAAEREKTAAILAKNDDKALIAGEIEAIKAREDFIRRIVAAGPDSHSKDDVSKLDFTPEKWAQAWTLIQNGMAETQKALAQKNVAIRNVDADIARLQQELNQVRTTQAKEQRVVRVNIEAAQDTDLDLSLTYETAGASWRPVYDARLDTSTSALDLEQYGQVSQQTGEDWNDIDLIFSTSQPAYGADMPRMSEWWVRLYQPVVVQLRAMSAPVAMDKQAMRQKIQNSMPVSDESSYKEEGVIERLEEKAAESQQAAAQVTEYAAEFRVPGHATLKSVRDTSKMFIGAVHMKAGLASQISPRLTPQAYLFAKITNTETYPLISGSVAKYRDGTFIGNSALTMLRPNETANLSFGVDDRVKVTYQRTRDEQVNPALILVGDMKVERQYQTKIQNLHKDPITVTVFEQYPVAGDADVKAELLDDQTTQGYAKDTENRQGVITWSGSYKPQEEKTFTIGFRVRYPKDRQISGL
jgi:uncharacterized protein (TIGR02231 family)